MRFIEIVDPIFDAIISGMYREGEKWVDLKCGTCPQGWEFFFTETVETMRGLYRM